MITRNGSRGVTLLELVFGLAVVAVLAGLALPGFRVALRAAAVRSAAYALQSGLQQARAGAILAGQPGVLCLTDLAGACGAPPAAARGFAVYLEGPHGAPARIAAQLLPGGVELRATRMPLRFQPLAASASTGTLTICDAQRVAAPRALIVSLTGRVRLADTAAEGCA